MCLCEVYERFKTPLKGTYEAYKVMKVCGYFFNDDTRFVTDTRKEPLKKRGWNVDKARERVWIGRHEDYPTGFHVWNTLKDAQENCCSNCNEEIWLVHVTEIVAEGLNEYCCSDKKGEVLIARKIKFIKKIEGV